jgi:hypothetical protein
MVSRVKLARPPFAHNQVGRCDRCACRRRAARDDRLALIKVAKEEGRSTGVYADDPSTDVSEKTPADGGGYPATNLRDLKPGQY